MGAWHREVSRSPWEPCLPSARWEASPRSDSGPHRVTCGSWEAEALPGRELRAPAPGAVSHRLVFRDLELLLMCP